LILKVTDRFFHRYFFVANLKKHVSSPKALISRHVHVPVHVHVQKSENLHDQEYMDVDMKKYRFEM
jgi:hypothetical protein